MLWCCCLVQREPRGGGIAFSVSGRWNIETDLRTLKQTLRLEELTCTTAEMVAKELDLAMMAYNLVRAVTCLAAQKAGIPPRSYSFTKVKNVINTFGPLIANAKTEDEAKVWAHSAD